jgi:nucleotide-binding universal stress UspA family protein
MSTQDTKPSGQPIVLVPLDGSKFGECAVPVALRLADGLNGHLKLVSVSTNGHVTKRPRYLNRYLNHLGDMIEAAGEVRVSPVVLEGSATKALLEFNNLSQPTLIVMSTHGRGPLRRAWIGSVADRLMRHVATPVVLVHPQERAECNVTEPSRINRILVALDGSKLAEGSLEWAKRIMAATGASCTLVRVANTSIPAWSPRLQSGAPETTDYMDVSCAESQEYLSAVKARLRKGGIAVETVVESERPGAVGILRCAEERLIDLIVMASHGRGGLKRLVLGSVADKVVRAADVPVLLVRPK